MKIVMRSAGQKGGCFRK